MVETTGAICKERVMFTPDRHAAVGLCVGSHVSSHQNNKKHKIVVQKRALCSLLHQHQYHLPNNLGNSTAPILHLRTVLTTLQCWDAIEEAFGKRGFTRTILIGSKQHALDKINMTN
jgi:hypothetical protein